MSTFIRVAFEHPAEIALLGLHVPPVAILVTGGAFEHVQDRALGGDVEARLICAGLLTDRDLKDDHTRIVAGFEA